MELRLRWMTPCLTKGWIQELSGWAFGGGRIKGLYPETLTSKGNKLLLDTSKPVTGASSSLFRPSGKEIQNQGRKYDTRRNEGRRNTVGTCCPDTPDDGAGESEWRTRIPTGSHWPQKTNVVRGCQILISSIPQEG
ncbi:hypothetical protein GGX14DRAFT_403532 [Mycena pura]|uniref:Uncharacterized protein n=1 Tax=Mycena pura TaxID=153505 RepID=A0AAD6V2Z2_9AGAR|nr:hypothetical protein GGX14DRAFT_403532 [Mycena pura]